MTQPEDRADRGSRRKRQNRERLVAAAAAVMSRKGVDASTIAEITEEADLGFGTFYNHFDSKEAVVDAVLGDGLASLGAALDRRTEGIDDAAMVLAICIRHLLATADRDPVFGWFVVRSPDASERLTQHLRHRAERDVSRGVRQKRFVVDDPVALAVALAGIVLEGTRAKLAGRATSDIDQRLATYALRLLGIDAQEARELAQAPLPPL